MWKYLLATACVMAPALAEAAVVNYTDRTAFEAALGTKATEGFEGVAKNTSLIGAPIDLGAFTIQTFSNYVNGWNFVGDSIAWKDDLRASNSRQVFGGLGFGHTMVLTFTQAILGFGADFGALNDFADSGAGTRSQFEVNGQVITAPAQNGVGGRTFFGFVSDTPFTQVVMRGLRPTEAFGMDNVTYGTPAPAPVPVPAGLPLLAGALGLGALLRKVARRRA